MSKKPEPKKTEEDEDSTDFVTELMSQAMDRIAKEESRADKRKKG